MEKLDNLIMLDDFLFVVRDQVSAVKICDNNPHVLVYVSGIANPFRLKHPCLYNGQITPEEERKWATDYFDSLQCQMATGYLDWDEYRGRDEADDGEVQIEASKLCIFSEK